MYIWFSPVSSPELLKPKVSFLSDESDKGVFCYVNKVTKPGELVAWGPNHVGRRLEPSLPSPTSTEGKGERLNIEPIINGQ